MNQIRNLIVIGASAGGIKAIIQVIEGFPETIDAAIVIVLHVSKKSNPDNLIAIFQRHTTLKCEVALDKKEIERGKIYLAQPEHHLLVKNHKMHLNQGPEENKYRPSIDVLFRSAGVHFGNRTIGIILTGMLDDGTSGMYAIKSCGGLCIVQNPSEAEYSDMPLSVLNRIEVDYMADLAEIPFIVQDILNKPLPPQIAIPNELKVEADITEKLMSDINDLKKIAQRSDFVCPDCGGGLWEVKNDPTHRYRCHTGHVYSEKLLYDLQDIQIEESIWVSIRMLEEKRNMLRLLAGRKIGNTFDSNISLNGKRIDDIEEHINRLKILLVKLSHNNDDIQSA
jgi:two-component system chemotaxis response regulator CheB